MLLSEYTKTLYYRLVSPTLWQQQLPKIGALLFKDLPGSHEKELHISENGYFTYRREDAFKYAGSAPEMEKEAKTIANTFLQEKNKKVSEYFAEKNIALPAIFPNGLYVIKATASYDKVGETSKLNHWCVEYGLRLPVLKWDKNTPALVAAVLAEYESPFVQTEDKAAALKDLVNKHLYAPLENASLKVYVGAKQKVIGMDYAFPLLETQPTPTALLNAPDRTRLSGLQAAEDVPALPDFMFREVNGLVVPFYIDGVVACREGVGGKRNLPQSLNIDEKAYTKLTIKILETRKIDDKLKIIKAEAVFEINIGINLSDTNFRTYNYICEELTENLAKTNKLKYEFMEEPTHKYRKDYGNYVDYWHKKLPFTLKKQIIPDIEQEWNISYNINFVYFKDIIDENGKTTYSGNDIIGDWLEENLFTIRLLVKPRDSDAGNGVTWNREIWMYGFYNIQTLAHEIGHAYGLNHANLINHDDNPVSCLPENFSGDVRLNNGDNLETGPLMSYAKKKKLADFEQDMLMKYPILLAEKFIENNPSKSIITIKVNVAEPKSYMNENQYAIISSQ